MQTAEFQSAAMTSKVCTISNQSSHDILASSTRFPTVQTFTGGAATSPLEFGLAPPQSTLSLSPAPEAPGSAALCSESAIRTIAFRISFYNIHYMEKWAGFRGTIDPRPGHVIGYYSSLNALSHLRQNRAITLGD